MARKSENGWLNTTQLADHFGVVVVTISRWASNPKLDFPKPSVINNRNYYSREACDAWLLERSHIKTVKTIKPKTKTNTAA